jgi:radical SAM superfamily enzyme YgiQ (UPF0313 family)
LARVLFLNPPFSLWGLGPDRFRHLKTATPPFGLLQLAACIRLRRHEALFLDATLEGWGAEETARRVVEVSPDYLVMCLFTSSVVAAGKVAELVKAAAPGCRVLVGGPHVTALPKRTLADFPSFDYGGVGEGEELLPAMLEELESEGRLSAPPRAGVVMRDGGEVVGGEPAPMIDDLDALPSPAWDLLPGGFSRYQAPLFGYRRGPVGTLITSRGCPFSCAFCDGAALGKRYRQQSPEAVIEQIRRLRDEWGIGHLIFYDDLFNLDRKRLERICSGLASEEPGLGWNADARVDTVDAESLRWMKEGGCWQLSFGIESGSQQMLDAMKKRTTTERVRQAVDASGRAGIGVKGLFILGFPGETRETVAETARFVRTLDMDGMNLTLFTPYPGCEIYPEAHRYGRFDEDFEKMNGIRPVFVPNGWTEEELEKAFGDLLGAFYHRARTLRIYARLGWESPSSVGRLVRSFGDLVRSGTTPNWG